MGKEPSMESTAWPWGWLLWSGRKAWRPAEAASSPWSSLRHLQNPKASRDLPWHLLGDPGQKERDEDFKYILCQDTYREIRSPKYSWAEMTKHIIPFLMESCLHEKFPPELVNHPVPANSGM